jgi:sulfonate transport system permease protein
MNSQKLKWLLETRWLSPIVLLTLWEFGSRSGVVPERTLAAPSSVVSTMLAMIVSGELPHNLAVSLVRAGIGLSIGIGVGIILGLAAGLSRRGNAAIDPLLQIKRTIPVVALSPLFIVWFGIGETTKIALIAFATMLPVYLNLYEGIRGVDVRLIDAARSFGLSRWALIRDVILPGTVPSLIVGIRYSLSIAVLMLVIAEQINATAGLGYLINNARDFMRTDIIVVCLLVYALLGLGGDLLMRKIERRALAWRPSVMELRA